MRIDTTPPPVSTPAPVVEQGADLSQLKRYLKALRRRWPVVVVLALVGAVVGWATTPEAIQQTILVNSYFKATHTLIDDGATVSGESSGSQAVNLSQAAFFVTTGDVPQRVADKLDVPLETVQSSLSAQARGDVAGLEITAISENPQEAVSLADTAATELVVFLNETTAARYNAQRDELAAELDALRTERDRLQEALRNDPFNEELSAQLTSIGNEYLLTLQRWSEFSSTGVSTTGLRTIQVASPIEISEDAFAARATENVLGPQPTTTLAPGDTPPSTSEAPAEPPDPRGRATAGALFGLFAGLGLVALLDRYDTRIRRREEVEGITGLPVIAEIPYLAKKDQRHTELLSLTSPRSHTAEAYRVVRTAVLFAKQVALEEGADDGEVIMVTSPGPDEGKTTTVANLAAVLAEGGLSVLVINCDFRRPKVHRFLTGETGGEDGQKLDVIATHGDVKAIKTVVPKVRLVTGVGEADTTVNPLEVVALQRRIVAFARQHFDVVLLDTAPFLTTNDASELIPDVDEVVLVARAGKTKKEAVKRAVEFLGRLGAPVIGTVITGADDAPAAQYYYYNYYRQEEGTGRRRGSRLPGGNGNGSAPPNGSTPQAAPDDVAAAAVSGPSDADD
ncbi:MAG: hypothetical protein MUF83_18090 [Acidimicrobiales bacterium]|nr:hypothetical protein [Acidimicrobiales bacterium]